MYFGLIGFGLFAGLFGFLVGLVIQVLFLLNLMRLLEAVHPQNRAMSPGLVWLNLIPVFSLGWMIYTVIKIKDSVRRENVSRWGASADEGNTHTVGLAYAILAAAAFVFSYGGYANRGLSVFAGLVSIAVLVLWIMYWVKTNRLKRDLERTSGRGYMSGGPYGPTGPYGPGAHQGGGSAYPPAGPNYGPGPGAGAGYGAGYGAAPTGQPQAPPAPPAPQPASSPESGEQTPPPESEPESRPTCGQCGTQLNPGDQFCRSCGTQVPSE